MSIFSTILEKLGLSKPAASSSTPAASGGKTPVASAGVSGPMDRGSRDDNVMSSAAHAGGASMSEVDVVKHLESISKDSGLDWKVSIVDLLKLLKMDSSREARNELAKELGCPDDLMSDSAKMNTWLHKTVLQKIAENGGNIPASLLK